MTLQGLSERAGFLAGGAFAPVTALVSWSRRSRMFHPVGYTCAARVLPASSGGREAALSKRLPEHALVRFSGAWWKRREWKDVLGCALRLAHAPLHEPPRRGDQDLLLATIRRPWTMPLAPLSTQVHDFLANDYYGVSPFHVEELGRIDLRLVPQAQSPQGASRGVRLASAIEQGRAHLMLEWAPYGRVWRRPDPRQFLPLARISLTDIIDLNERALRFDPFQSGLGIQPVGSIHATRILAYGASQAARGSRTAR